MGKPSVGVVSIGVYIPQGFHTSEDIARASGVPKKIVEEKMGMIRKVMPSSEKDHPISMGIEASRIALERGNVDPEEVDLVIWAGEEYKEHPMVTAGIKLQHEVGAPNAWAFDISQRCGTMIVGLKLAKDMITANEDINSVLIAAGYRNCDLINYQNQRTRFMFNLAAGGAAAVLRKNHPKNHILEASFMSDGSFADDVYVPAGGTMMPASHETLERGLHHLDVRDPEDMKRRLDDLSMKNFLKVVGDALEKSGYTIKEIDYLAILHMKRSAHKYILSELGLSESQTTYFEEYGHLGQCDQILSLELGLRSGKIRDGSLVVLVSAGIGYAWDAMVIKWGPH
ncbi:MAG: 3-oxoacyl-ACP synthase [Candidatus Jordarchaeum sp.]|uniref:3-oxoacyl-ACP synthase n=1 Tax=Candidatus Jordarchaeum sp. TaxID=2823881 RepID=UPI0040493538